nr:MAG TPA: hypothetical protein [Caudoviricetes sp.]
MSTDPFCHILKKHYSVCFSLSQFFTESANKLSN